MSDELIKELRSYPAHYTAAHKAADALESAEKNRLAMHYYACRLEDDLVKLEAAAESLREHIAEQQLDIVALGQEVGRLREALEKIAENAWVGGIGEAELYEGWREVAKKRGDIARAALGEEKKS